MTRFSTKGLAGAVVLSSMLTVSGCKKKVAVAEADAPIAATVDSQAVYAQQTTDYLEVPAHFMADPADVVHIYPPLSGRIFGLKILPGQEVTKGQVIAQLESNDVNLARSDYEKTKIEVLRADRALARGKLLLAHEVLSQADEQELEATDQVAHSELERSRQRIRELGFSEDGTSDIVALRAPISGAVLDIGTASGEMQRSLDNATSVATIANLDSIWASGDVFERDLGALHGGAQVTVVVPAYPGVTLTGTIANISDALDPATHTLKLRVVLANPGHKLKPEMFATIRVAGATRRAFLVPESAVLHQGEQTFVFLASGGTGSKPKYDERAVQTGRTTDHNGVRTVEVLGGLQDGDKVVTTGGALLRPVQGD